MQREHVFAAFFLVAFLFLLYQFYLILSDFIGPLSYAGLLAFIFFPVYRRLRDLLNGREGLAATVMSVAVVLLVVVPTVYLLTLITVQSVALYQGVSELVSSGRVHELMDRMRVSHMGQLWGQLAPSIDAWKIDIPEFAVRASQTVSTFLVAQAPAAAANVFRVVVYFFLTVFALFFFFRDGQRMVLGVRDLIPLDPAIKDQIMVRFSDTLTAVVLGTAATAVAQGVLGGIAYWGLGVPFALLLAGATAFFSLLPYGGPVVWLGVAVYLGLNAEYARAIAMLAWGTIVIGTADNIIRPLVIGGRTQIPTILLFFSIIGGLQVYGFIGLFLGPAIIATLVAFARIFREQYVAAANPILAVDRNRPI